MPCPPRPSHRPAHQVPIYLSARQSPSTTHPPTHLVARVGRAVPAAPAAASLPTPAPPPPGSAPAKAAAAAARGRLAARCRCWLVRAQVFDAMRKLALGAAVAVAGLPVAAQLRLHRGSARQAALTTHSRSKPSHQSRRPGHGVGLSTKQAKSWQSPSKAHIPDKAFSETLFTCCPAGKLLHHLGI